MIVLKEQKEDCHKIIIAPVSIFSTNEFLTMSSKVVSGRRVLFSSSEEVTSESIIKTAKVTKSEIMNKMKNKRIIELNLEVNKMPRIKESLDVILRSHNLTLSLYFLDNKTVYAISKSSKQLSGLVRNFGVYEDMIVFPSS